MSAPVHQDAVVACRDERGLETKTDMVAANPARSSVTRCCTPSLDIDFRSKSGTSVSAKLPSLRSALAELQPLKKMDVQILDAFTRSMLSRDDPDYAPTPYAAWAEETVEGGCIFTICFGNLGGGGGSAGNNYNACSPGHPNYNPANCPHDLTYASWPVGVRPKLQKVNNDKVIGHIFAKNTGTRDVYVPMIPGNLQFPFAFFSLVRLGSETPLVASAGTFTSPYGDQCFEFRMALYFEVVNPFVIVDLKAGQAKPMAPIIIQCGQSSTRPAGRYRLHIHIDPMSAHDTPGYDGNNIGHSGALDWVHLRN